jgi:hypothetical protein
MLTGGDFCIKIVGFWGGKKVNFCSYIVGGYFYFRGSGGFYRDISTGRGGDGVIFIMLN